jgi:putative lipoprotein (rSAM/lipoprotein system)
MNQKKTNILRTWNLFIFSLMTLLGFGCVNINVPDEGGQKLGGDPNKPQDEEQDFRAEYGVPMASYKIMGVVVDAETKQPLPGVIFGRYENDAKKTDKDGKFVIEFNRNLVDTVLVELKFRVDEIEGIKYLPKDTIIPITWLNLDATNDDGWNWGTINQEIEIHLERDEEVESIEWSEEYKTGNGGIIAQELDVVFRSQAELEAFTIASDWSVHKIELEGFDFENFMLVGIIKSIWPSKYSYAIADVVASEERLIVKVNKEKSGLWELMEQGAYPATGWGVLLVKIAKSELPVEFKYVEK